MWWENTLTGTEVDSRMFQKILRVSRGARMCFPPMQDTVSHFGRNLVFGEGRDIISLISCGWKLYPGLGNYIPALIKGHWFGNKLYPFLQLNPREIVSENRKEITRCIYEDELLFHLEVPLWFWVGGSIKHMKTYKNLISPKWNKCEASVYIFAYINFISIFQSDKDCLHLENSSSGSSSIVTLVMSLVMRVICKK